MPRPEGRGERKRGDRVPAGLSLEAEADREAEGPRELVAGGARGRAERGSVVPVVRRRGAARGRRALLGLLGEGVEGREGARCRSGASVVVVAVAGDRSAD